MTAFEFVIVDDSSTDRSAEIIAQYAEKDNRVQPLFLGANQGCAGALNMGIAQARSELIARMDADDYSMPHRLLTQYNFLQKHPEIDILGSAVRWIDEKSGEVIREHKLPVLHKQIIKQRYTGTMVYHPSIMVRTSVYGELGGYRIAAHRVEDLDLWLRAYRRFTFHNLPEVLLDFTKRNKPMNLSSRRAFQSTIKVRYNAMRQQGELIRHFPALAKLTAAYLQRTLLSQFNPSPN